MAEVFERCGASCREIDVKLFGGAYMLSGAGARMSIGQQNIEAARSAVKQAGLKIVAEHVGGERGRKLFFFPHTGEVLVRSLTRMAIDAQMQGLS